MSRVLYKRPIILSVQHHVILKSSFGLKSTASHAAVKQDEPKAQIDTVSWDKAKPFKQIPGPNPIPIFGNTWRFLPFIGEFYGLEHRIVNFFRKQNQTYGEIVRMEGIINQPRSVYLFNPEDIELVYKLESISPERDILPSLSYFRKTYRQDLFQDARGLLTSQGKEWSDIRTKVNPIMMQPKMVKQYAEPVDEISREFIAKIKRMRKSDGTINADMYKEVNKWSLESITFIAVNSKLNCLSDDLPNDSVPYKLMNLVEEIFIISGQIDFKPSLWKYFPTPAFKKAMRLYNEQVSLGEDLIKEAKERIESENKEERDPSHEPSVLEKLLKIDPKVAVVMCLDMLLAGVDTTSTALIQVLYQLSINSSKQETLRDEISSILPNKDSKLTAEMLNSMPYLKACIKEAGRLYPVTPGTFRVLSKDTVLSGYQVPKGTLALFPHMSLCVTEKYFPRTLEFIPERWLRDQKDTEIWYKNVNPFCVMQFGFGSRSCIGRRFAELELEIATIHFIKNFNISWHGPPPTYIHTSLDYVKGSYSFVFKDVN